MFAPGGLFDLPAQTLPPHWYFAAYDGLYKSGNQAWARWVAKWGYVELVKDPHHSNGLLDYEPEALAIFARELAAAGASPSDE